MGCRHSSSPPESPVKTVQNTDPIVLKSKISIHRAQVINHRTPNGVKSSSTSRLSISAKKVNNYDTNVSIDIILFQNFRHVFHCLHHQSPP
jgi:hypothetical protein